MLFGVSAKSISLGYARDDNIYFVFLVGAYVPTRERHYVHRYLIVESINNKKGQIAALFYSHQSSSHYLFNATM